MVLSPLTWARTLNSLPLPSKPAYPPSLQALDPAQHVQMPGRVLLNHVLHIVRPQGLLEFPFGDQELQNPVRGGGSLADVLVPVGDSFPVPPFSAP